MGLPVRREQPALVLRLAHHGRGDRARRAARDRRDAGRSSEGEAWFRTDDAQRRLEWGSENPANDYTGWLQVSAKGSGSSVELGLHIQREDEDDSVGQTLANVQRILNGS